MGLNCLPALWAWGAGLLAAGLLLLLWAWLLLLGAGLAAGRVAGRWTGGIGRGGPEAWCI